MCVCVCSRERACPLCVSPLACINICITVCIISKWKIKENLQKIILPNACALTCKFLHLPPTHKPPPMPLYATPNASSVGIRAFCENHLWGKDPLVSARHWPPTPTLAPNPSQWLIGGPRAGRVVNMSPVRVKKQILIRETLVMLMMSPVESEDDADIPITKV